jgi:predicted PurR-regulated permease PerM
LFALALFSPSLSSHKSLSAGSSLIALAALVALLYYGRDFFIALIVSALSAFILDPAVVAVMKLRLPRPAATGIVIGIAFIAVYLLSAMAWSQVLILAEDLPTYTSRLNELWDKANERLDALEKQSIDAIVPSKLRQHEEQIQQKPQEAMKARRRRAGLPVQPAQPAVPPSIQEVRIRSDPKPAIASLYSYISGYFHALLMLSFIPFLVYFMLSWRDHIRKSVLQLFQSEHKYTVGKSWSGIGDSTRAYVLGNFLLWICLSSVSAVAFFFLGVPYWPLVGPLSGLFSLVPYAGLPLSIVPPVAAALAIPNQFKIVVTLAVVTALLHVVAMNFLYAKIIGRRVRLNPLVVTIALMFWGSIWGGIGLILAIPITAAFKTICDNVEALEAYGKLLGD